MQALAINSNERLITVDGDSTGMSQILRGTRLRTDRTSKSTVDSSNIGPELRLQWTSKAHAGVTRCHVLHRIKVVPKEGLGTATSSRWRSLQLQAWDSFTST